MEDWRIGMGRRSFSSPFLLFRVMSQDTAVSLLWPPLLSDSPSLCKPSPGWAAPAVF